MRRQGIKVTFKTQATINICGYVCYSRKDKAILVMPCSYLWSIVKFRWLHPSFRKLWPSKPRVESSSLQFCKGPVVILMCSQVWDPLCTLWDGVDTIVAACFPSPWDQSSHPLSCWEVGFWLSTHSEDLLSLLPSIGQRDLPHSRLSPLPGVSLHLVIGQSGEDTRKDQSTCVGKCLTTCELELHGVGEELGQKCKDGLKTGFT